VDFDPQILRDAVEIAVLKNLRSITVEGVGRADIYAHKSRPWLRYDYHRLKKVILKHVPKLHVFSWVSMTTNDGEWN
jgi:hypothetical protein